MVRKTLVAGLILGLLFVLNAPAFPDADQVGVGMESSVEQQLEQATLANAWQDDDCEQQDHNLCEGYLGNLPELPAFIGFTVQIYIGYLMKQQM